MKQEGLLLNGDITITWPVDSQDHILHKKLVSKKYILSYNIVHLSITPSISGLLYNYGLFRILVGLKV